MKRIAVLGLTALCAALGAQSMGTWTNINWPNGYYVRGIHLILFPDNRIMLWNNQLRFGVAAPDTRRIVVAEPGQNFAYDQFVVETTAINHTTNLFCGGHTFLEDGRLVVAGGHKFENGYGDDRINVFDYKNPKAEWITGDNPMIQYRWYPSVTHLPDRRVLITMGIGGPTHAPSYIPELWTPDVPWEESSLKDFSATLAPFIFIDSYYPFFFIDPKDGNLFLANRGKADEAPSPNKKLNLATLQWSDYAVLTNQNSNVMEQYASAVMINAKNSANVREAILLMSGGGPTNEQGFANGTALFINLLATNPTFSSAQNMQRTRQCHTLIALPTADVIAFGGTDRFGTAGIPYPAEAALRATPELWNPFAPDRATRPWRLLATPPDIIGRGYHSTAILLADGRVMTSGGEPEPEGPPVSQWVSQFYSPPYGGRDDWETRRPTLSGVPAIIRYGEPFQVTMSPNATSGRPIKKVMLMSGGAVTHAINERQEIYECDFSHVSGNTYLVTPPPMPKDATPGYYMMFAVDDADEGGIVPTRIIGIPSFATWVQLKDFEQIFVTNGQVLGGFATQSLNWTKANSLLLADNQYFGGEFRYGPGLTGSRVELVFSGIAKTPAPTKVRLRVQAWSTSQAQMTTYFKNVTTGAWAQVGSPQTLSNTDKDLEVVADNANFVDASGNISAKVHFRRIAPSIVTPSVKIDVAELGVR